MFLFLISGLVSVAGEMFTVKIFDSPGQVSLKYMYINISLMLASCSEFPTMLDSNRPDQ